MCLGKYFVHLSFHDFYFQIFRELAEIASKLPVTFDILTSFLVCFFCCGLIFISVFRSQFSKKALLAAQTGRASK